MFFADHLSVAHGASARPNLEEVIVLDVGEVFLPRGGHFGEVRLVGFPIVVARWSRHALVIFALVPDDRTDAIGEASLLDAPEHSSVDRREVGGVFLAALMLIDAASADGGVDDEDGHFLAGDEAFGEFHSPVSEFGFFTFCGLPNWLAPKV